MRKCTLELVQQENDYPHLSLRLFSSVYIDSLPRARPLACHAGLNWGKLAARAAYLAEKQRMKKH